MINLFVISTELTSGVLESIISFGKGDTAEIKAPSRKQEHNLLKPKIKEIYTFCWYFFPQMLQVVPLEFERIQVEPKTELSSHFKVVDW